MGYSTNFTGSFSLDRKLDPETEKLLHNLNVSRRMKRDISKLAQIKGICESEAIKKWGSQGQFYFDKTDIWITADGSIIDQNCPPEGQPSLWCNWMYNKFGSSIEWDGNEKFYHYIEWIRYLITHVLEPKGYILNGLVEWEGEDSDDRGRIIINANIVKVQRAEITWKDDEDN